MFLAIELYDEIRDASRRGALFILARSQASLCPTHFPVNSGLIKPPAVLT
jgi:hypothetical protein